MTISAVIPRHSIAPNGQELMAFSLKYQRFITPEALTHREWSRSSSSSRAIPTARFLKNIRENPAMPISWGANQSGMQAGAEHYAPVEVPLRYHPEFRLRLVNGQPSYSIPQDVEIHTSVATGELCTLMNREDAWRAAVFVACDFSEAFSNAGYHKQVANRLNEIGQHISLIASMTSLDNFLMLRDHVDAEPNIRKLAQEMRYAYKHSVPTPLKEGEWHLPYVENEEALDIGIVNAVKCSTARCARVSYNNHDGTLPSVEKDIVTHDRLVVSEPMHASPSEHPAQILTHGQWALDSKSNFARPWVQYRKYLEAGVPLCE